MYHPFLFLLSQLILWWLNQPTLEACIRLVLGFLTFFEAKDLSSHSFRSWTKGPNAYMDYTLNSGQYWASNLSKSISSSLFWFLWNNRMTNQAFLWVALPQRQSVRLQSKLLATWAKLNFHTDKHRGSCFQKQRRMRLLKWRMCVRVSPQSPQWVSSRLPADRRSHRQPTNPFACCRVLKKTAHHGGHGTMVGFKEPAHQANPLVSYSQDIVPDSFRRCFTSYSAKKTYCEPNA